MRIILEIISYVILALGIVLMLAGFVYFDEFHQKPTAMDVYQGKTTLEYKVVDGVKVDSIVVFKNNLHNGKQKITNS